MNENQNNGLYGFLFCTLLVVWAATSWGEPDLIDALIYYFSDGYYKHQAGINLDCGEKSIL